MKRNNDFKNMKFGSLILQFILVWIVTFSFFAFIQSVLGINMNFFFSATLHIVIILLIIRKFNKHRISLRQITGDLSLHKLPWLKLFSIQALLIVFAVLSIIAIFFIIGLFDSNFYKELLTEEITHTNNSAQLIILTYILSFTLVPIMEELLFRGYLFNKWGENFGILKAMIFCSILFSLLHWNTGFISHFILGVFCCMAYVKTKRLIVPMLLHAVNNIIAGTYMLFPTELDTTYEEEALTQFIIEMQIAFKIGALLFIVLVPIVCYVLYRYYKGLPKVTPYQLNQNQNI
ncbi:membrane protease YdiL (CAAX protease family) [Halalkalibacter nanhaiisediminis]|uniref:Membrane protease YdiL (CAAX protease family) n=2 Tax=Halalkalibacter nanhaiisediminis TaxID=688079 RepID=A0A562QMQ7_9BACI|nr:membrane protease YdiL (CAAX protease family) [Halalkalibacter nanhaiisediminis]